MVRHDFAVYALLASAPSLIALAAFRDAGSRAGSGSTPGVGARRLRPYAAGFGIAFGIPALALLLSVPLREMIFELVECPARIFPAMRRLPYPPLLVHPSGFSTSQDAWLPGIDLAAVPFYAPLLLYLLAFLTLAARIRKRGRDAALDGRDLRLAALALFGSFAFNNTRFRADLVHGVAMILPSYVVAAALMRDASVSGGRGRWPRQAGIALVCLLSLFEPMREARHVLLERLHWTASPATAGARPRCRDAGVDREAAAAFLGTVVPPGQRILVACGRHDKVFVNEPILYVLAGRLPCTRYHSFDPGVATTLDAQREIVNGLVRHRVEYVVRSDEADNVREPNGSALSTGVAHLDAYLRAHYVVCRRFGPHLSVWRRSTTSFSDAARHGGVAPAGSATIRVTPSPGRRRRAAGSSRRPRTVGK